MDASVDGEGVERHDLCFLEQKAVKCLSDEQFLAARKSQWLPEQVGGLFLNIHYENQHLSCVTGLSLNQFTLDKTLEREWDESIRTFLRKEELPFEE